MERMEELEVIKKYQNMKDSWYPMVDHIYSIFPNRTENGDHNIGWNAGVLDGNRPFFVECWAVDGITLLTIFVSSDDLEDISKTDLLKKFQEIDYYREKAGGAPTDVVMYRDSTGNSFFSINIVVGDDYNTYIDGAKIFPFRKLNEYIEQNAKTYCG